MHLHANANTCGCMHLHIHLNMKRNPLMFAPLLYPFETDFATFACWCKASAHEMQCNACYPFIEHHLQQTTRTPCMLAYSLRNMYI